MEKSKEIFSLEIPMVVIQDSQPRLESVQRNIQETKTKKIMTTIEKFDDLVFTPHPNGIEGAVQSQHTFDNGITISVIGGYGIESFEVAAWHEGFKWIQLSEQEHDDVLGWQSKEDITEIIKKLKDM
jgi:hypothetical protein